MLIKQKSLLLPRSLALANFGKLLSSVFNKGKSAILPLFNSFEVLSSASDKAKLFPENCSNNSNLDDSGIFLAAFPSRTNLQLNNISVTPKLVKKFITNVIRQR